MRPIKFRAWDGKKMFAVQGLVFEYQKPTVIENIGENYKEDTDAKALMQFTGLNDKNGKEVYEGDFIRMKQQTWAYAEHLMQVQWSEEYASFQAMVVSTLGHLDGTAKVGTPYSMSVATKHGEVIGNIYENPELLKV